jgi:hypothetical protein
MVAYEDLMSAIFVRFLVLGQGENFMKVIFLVYWSQPLIQMISATQKITKIRKDSQKSFHNGRFFLREFCQSEKSKFESWRCSSSRNRDYFAQVMVLLCSLTFQSYLVSCHDLRPTQMSHCLYPPSYLGSLDTNYIIFRNFEISKKIN